MFRASVVSQDTELPLGVFFFSLLCVVVKEQVWIAPEGAFQYAISQINFCPRSFKVTHPM